jgi:hypothetical protein
VFAGRGEKEIKIDEYDNRRNPYGFSGEASVIVPLDPTQFQDGVAYQIQIEDDLRQKSQILSGQIKLPTQTLPGFYGTPGMPVAPQDDNWGKNDIRAGRGQGGTKDGKSNDMIDKLQKVSERFDTPPSLDSIKVNILGPENVSFSSNANDDKGLREIIFRVYDAAGNKVDEQTLSNLGKKWSGSTQPVKVSSGGAFRVVAQAFDTAGNTSKEQVATFSMKGAAPPPVNGTCGNASGQKLAVAPVGDLCIQGTATAISGNGPWNWNCTGQNGG